MVSSSLIKKYDVAGPRYTSYPTVPFWDIANFSSNSWLNNLKNTFDQTNTETGISLYIHLPYCESLCTFCACHKRITKRHEVELPYLEAVLKEWEMYLTLFNDKPKITEIHLGGGTPSFFSSQNLTTFLSKILQSATISDDYEFSFEGHPNNTTQEHLQSLYDLGFRRVSFGVQDYDPIVQNAIHRIQPLENVKKVTEQARKIGYNSISHDLVFGLPFQKISSIENTIKKTIELNPDRLAFYSYAHVPWIKGNGQRGFDESNLPSGEEKRVLYERGRQIFEENGYFEIGMDHFALKHDSMYKAMSNGTLNRNFMGYTTTQSKILLGLGASSISDSWIAFSQNEKDIDLYLDKIQNNQFPIIKGHIHSERDLSIRQLIKNIICQFETTLELVEFDRLEQEALKSKLADLQSDGLISLNQNSLRVTQKGKAFVRNICMVFDEYLNEAKSSEKLFSKTI